MSELVPPRIGPAGPIFAENFAKIGPPGPLLLPKSVWPDQFWQPKLQKLLKSAFGVTQSFMHSYQFSHVNWLCMHAYNYISF